MIELYIKNQKVDLPDNFALLWSYKSKDLSDPAAIKNGFSKQINLEGTPNNNTIFNSLYRIDSNYFTKFNPNVRNEFILMNNNSIVESGYVQLNKISKKGSDITYSLTLFGGIGDFFYNLSKDEDGNSKTLYNLRWYWLDNIYNTVSPYTSLKDSPIDTVYHNIMSFNDGGYYDEQTEKLMNISPSHIALGWCDLASDYQYIESNGKKFTNVRDDIIFMPFDTGKPNIENFDCTSLLQREITTYNSSSWELERRKCFPNTLNGVTYYAKTVELGGNPIGDFVKTKSERDLSQLETGMLINTQMVPGVRISKLLDVICDKDNNGGYDVDIDNVKDDPIIKDGFVLLDRLKSDDIENVIVLDHQVDTNINVVTTGSSPDVDDHCVEDIEFYNSDGISYDMLDEYGISEFSFTNKHILTTQYKAIFGGYDQSHTPNWQYSFAEGVGDKLESEITFPLFNIYPNSYTTETFTLEDESYTNKLYNFRGAKIGQGKATNMTYHTRQYRYNEDFIMFRELNYNNAESTFYIDKYDETAKKTLSPVGWKINKSTNLANIILHFDIIIIKNETDSKRLYCIFPYILNNDAPTIDGDPTQYDSDHQQFPTIVTNWTESAAFKNSVKSIVESNLSSKFIAPSGSQFRTFWYWNNLYTTKTSNNVEIQETKNYIEKMWNPSLLRIENRLFAVDQTDLMCFDVDITATQMYTNQLNFSFDYEEIEYLGGDKVYFETAQLHIPFAQNSDNTVSVSSCINNIPKTIGYIWQPVQYEQLMSECNEIPTEWDHDSGNPNFPIIYRPNAFPMFTNNPLYPVGNYNWQWKDDLKTWNSEFPFAQQINIGDIDRDECYSDNKLNITHNILMSSFNPIVSNKAIIGYEFIYKKSLFNNTNSPYEYLISLAKLLNWKFEYNYIEKKVNIMHKDDYYTQIPPPNLTIDYNYKYEITPYIMNKGHISIGTESIDSYANYLYNKAYEDDYNINTYNNNYSFNTDEENILKGTIFKSSPEFVPNTPLMTQAPPYIPTPYLGSTKVYRWNSSTDTDYTTVEIYPTLSYLRQNINAQYDYPMINCYDANYNYVSPKNTIVLFNGFLSNEKTITRSDSNKYCWIKPNYFGITSYIPSLYNILNEGNPCYTNSILGHIDSTINERWMWRNDDQSVWPGDIPFFTTIQFLDKENKRLDNSTSTLMNNKSSYYMLNPNYTIKIRIKSQENIDVGDGIYAPMTLVHSQFNYYRYNDEQTHFCDTPTYYNNTLLDAISNSADNINKYQEEINNITDKDARQIKLRVKLNTTPNVALKSIYTLSGGKYIITSIDNYDITKNNPFCDVTLQKIINI